MPNNNQQNQSNQVNTPTGCASCGCVTIAECEEFRERLRTQDLNLERKLQEILVTVATTQQQLKMLMRILSVLAASALTFATTLTINFLT